MPLQHREEEPPRAGGPRFTEDELSAVLDGAIARHGEAQRRQDDARLASLEDALDIARQLDIPVEHVHAAAAELEKSRLRGRRRILVRRKRRANFLGAAGLLGAISLFSTIFIGLLGGGPMVWLFMVGLPLWLPVLLLTLYLGWRWTAAPVTDAEADAMELPPVPGECRVCGRPAQNERSTFCEEHRHKMG